MALYEVIISPKALSQLDAYIGYIQYTLLNAQAAKAVWDDAVDTRDELAKSAGGSIDAEIPELTRAVLEEIVVRNPTELTVRFLDKTEKNVTV